MDKHPTQRDSEPRDHAQSFIHTEEVGALILLAAAAAAVIWANSPWSNSYDSFWHSYVTFETPLISIHENLQHLVNDGLMAIFFFVVGLEIKHELLHGELSGVRRASLPVLAAIGGMLGPALTYLMFNPSGQASFGWGIPMATDIAFALGVLALLGRRIPVELRVFLLALAVVDDLGAITVIAVFYTEAIQWSSLGISAALLVVAALSVRIGIRSMVFYIIMGFLVWYFMLESGVHATLAGVLLAVIVPPASGQLEKIEEMIHPWVSLLILPLFALANAGIVLTTDTLSAALGSSVTLGIVAGLLAGKSIGIFGLTWLAVRLGIGKLPSGVSWTHVLGVAFLAGIGFTVAIFISGIAFYGTDLVEQAKMGIFGASIVAAILGYGILRFTGSGARE